MRVRMELFARIRRDARIEGVSIRGLAKRYQIGRDTVRQALSDPVPPARKTPLRSSPRLDPSKEAIDAMLSEDTTAPRKQRHTARRILARLIEEHGAEELSYSTVRDYVRVRRAQIDVEAGRRVEVFVPQEHAPGAEAEVDFGEVWVVLDGVMTKCHMFVFRLSHSGKAIHRIYPTQAQEAFLEGHIEAFQVLGGIPTKHIRWYSGRGGSAKRMTGGCCSVRTTASVRSIASPALPGRMRRAELRARWAGSGVTGSLPCQRLRVWMSSTAEFGDGRTSPMNNCSWRCCRRRSLILVWC